MRKKYLAEFTKVVNGEARKFKVIASNKERVFYDAILPRGETEPPQLLENLSLSPDFFFVRTGWRG